MVVFLLLDIAILVVLFIVRWRFGLIEERISRSDLHKSILNDEEQATNPYEPTVQDSVTSQITPVKEHYQSL